VGNMKATMDKPEKSESEWLKQRLEKANELKERGVDLFPHRWERTHSAADAAKLTAGIEATERTEHSVRVAGRLVQRREMGKASFAHILDGDTKIQLYFKKDILGPDVYRVFRKDLYLGDYIGVAGIMFKTRTGETTIEVTELTLLAKALRPPPEKFHGLKDVDTRFRKRHLDLIANPDAREVFKKRSKIISSVRKTLEGMDFLEVETPILLQQAGGASARPFETHHNALDQNMCLRIATELPLKKLVIGGLNRVYEIGRIFRNEGIDTRHNPEFTTLEAYQAYTDYHGMAELFEQTLANAAEAIGVTEVEYRGKKLSLKPPYPRLYLPELWKECVGGDIHDVLAGKGFNRAGLETAAKKHNISFGPTTPDAKVFDRIIDDVILAKHPEPMFLLDHPTAITPLAKLKPGDESLVERFEFFVGGDELANAYTELNDPLDQRSRFEEQAKQKQAGNDEAELLDSEFVEAMEHGMPPMGGIGIGIDRLVMVLTGTDSIREVILFPTLKQE
jgi:lysyl-tRNA synthetase class 2